MLDSENIEKAKAIMDKNMDEALKKQSDLKMKIAEFIANKPGDEKEARKIQEELELFEETTLAVDQLHLMYQDMAMFYLNSGNLEKAKKYAKSLYLVAKEDYKITGDKEDLGDSYKLLMLVASYCGDVDSLKWYGEKAAEIFENEAKVIRTFLNTINAETIEKRCDASLDAIEEVPEYLPAIFFDGRREMAKEILLRQKMAEKGVNREKAKMLA